ncbi:MAG: hypothetical protein AB9907_14855 [Flexilinea sp.]
MLIEIPEDFEFDLTCPVCSQEFNETFGRLKNNNLVICPGCGAEITVDMSKLIDDWKGINKNLDDIFSEL